MTRFVSLILAALALLPVPVSAHTEVWVEEWVEEWNGVEWVRIADGGSAAASPAWPGAARLVAPHRTLAERAIIGAYGPFRVIDAQTAALVDVTDASAPEAFAAMLRDHPQIAVLEFVDAPGTLDDRANLALGRMIREQGLVTRAPAGGSVRSGAVELFLAGVTREVDPLSEFAVHGWLDDRGRGAEDYPADAPEHQRYLAYYTEMGMDAPQAAAFYAMTNAVPYESARWLSGGEMASWMGLPSAASLPHLQQAPLAPPRLAYLDLGALLQ